ncbi:hypothetical protein ACUXAV_006751 [Cupriavidus metallidurans]
MQTQQRQGLRGGSGLGLRGNAALTGRKKFCKNC